MKFTIEGLSQQKLLDHKLDCRDAMFLRWFIDFASTGKMRIHVEKENVYHWIDHSTVIEELPILGISRTDSLSRYIGGLIEKGALERHIIKRGQDKGTEAYYRILPDLVYEMISDGEHKADQSSDKEHLAEQPSATHGRTDDWYSSTKIPLQEEKGVAKDLDTSRPIEPEEAPSKDPPLSFSVEKTLREYAPGTKIDAETRQAIDQFGEAHGIDALGDVIREYIDKKDRDKVRSFVNDDLPGKLADATLARYESSEEKPESKKCDHGHVYTGDECYACEKERPYRESGQEMPVCPNCRADQIQEVRTGAYGCLACGNDYGLPAREYFREVATEV